MKPNMLRNFFSNRPNFNQNCVSYPTVSEVTEDAVQMWATLPSDIRLDPSLESFRQEYERINGSLPSDDDQHVLMVEHSGAHDSHPVNSEPTELDLISENGTEAKKSAKNGHNGSETANPSHMENGNEIEIEYKDSHKSKSPNPLNVIKVVLLIAVWILFTGILMLKDEKTLTYHQLAIPINESKTFIVNDLPPEPRFGIVVDGVFTEDSSNTTNFLFIYLKHMSVDGYIQIYDALNIEDRTLKIPIIENLDLIDATKRVKKEHIFYLDARAFEGTRYSGTVLQLEISSNLPINFAIDLAYDSTPIDKSLGVIYAAIILLGLYIMIIWEIVDRTFAAIAASTLSIAILALLNERPTMPEILSWIDVETLLLLFGMMTIVAILSETGLFDYLAVYAFKITKGEIWPLINCLCLFTAFLSSLLDNVTTLLLMGPVSIRLCEVIKLNPVQILPIMIIFSNIGGAVTPVGDPPNIIIASNSYVVKNDVDFLTFTIHMSLGIVFVMIQTYVQLRLKYRSINDLRSNEPQDVQNLRNEIESWKRAASSLNLCPGEENILHETMQKRIAHFRHELEEKLRTGKIPVDVYQRTLHDLQEKYSIRNRILLIKSLTVMAIVLCSFFFHSLPYIERLSLGWTALLGAILLLILYDRHDIETIMVKVEWTTLLFFAALFVLMESLAKLGLIEWIGNQTEAIILSVSEEYRLAVAIIIILWVSAIASAFVDNIPLTTMMIKITISLTQKEALHLPLTPLVWALAFGACLGGNGTLIGASANIVAAGVAEQHGYRISFAQFFKVGFPSMLGSLVVASGYLLVCHVLFTWH